MKTKRNAIIRLSAFVLLMLVASGANAMADERGNSIVARAGTVLKEYNNYKVKFTVLYDGMDDIHGEYVVSRDRYNLKVDEQRQFSDGKVRYEVYDFDREIIIDNTDLSSNNIMTNPTRAFDFAPSEFNASYKGEVTRNGVKAHKVVLTPVKTTPGMSKITLYVSAVSELPVAIDYDYDGEVIEINIKSVEKLASVDEALFKYNSANYKGYEIIDFR